MKIIAELTIIKPAPKRVSAFGISPQMKYPNNIANTKFKYFVGVTSDASAILSDTVSKILATEPIIPVKIKRKSSNFDGMIQPKGVLLDQLSCLIKKSIRQFYN